MSPTSSLETTVHHWGFSSVSSATKNKRKTEELLLCLSSHKKYSNPFFLLGYQDKTLVSHPEDLCGETERRREVQEMAVYLHVYLKLSAAFSIICCLKRWAIPVIKNRNHGSKDFGITKLRYILCTWILCCLKTRANVDEY